MTGRIPQDFIDDLIQRTDIVAVIGSRVQLTRAGREFKARCPFHSEKTPSFTVSPQKGFYHCFGCGAHGTALGFLLDYERLDFPAAVEELARLAGVEVPHSEEERTTLGPLYEVLEEAARFFRGALREHSSAIDYLKQRGLDGPTARDYALGYAPPGWDNLLGWFDAKQVGPERLLAAGLVAARDTGGFYDRFRDRVMFPIRDSRGRVLGFGGRVIGAGEPKYLNSPETAVFHKGRELYGLYEARQALRSIELLLVVEGYMDVVALAAHGVRNVVGTLGTATTGEHVRRLFSACNDLVFCFDGDRAGRAAAWRALQACLPEMRDGRQVRFLMLPEGEDPDSLVRSEGAEAFRARLDGALLLSDYLLGHLAEEARPESLDGKARLADLARPLLQQMPDGVYRELLTARLAALVGLPDARLRRTLGFESGPEDAAAAAGRPANAAARTARVRAPGSRGSVARQAISLLLHYPATASRVPAPPELGGLPIPGAALALALHESARTQPAVRPAALLERFRERPEFPHLQKLLAEEPLVGEDAAEQELAGCFRQLLRQSQQSRLTELLGRAAEARLSEAERSELRDLQQALAGAESPGQADR